MINNKTTNLRWHELKSTRCVGYSIKCFKSQYGIGRACVWTHLILTLKWLRKSTTLCMSLSWYGANGHAFIWLHSLSDGATHCTRNEKVVTLLSVGNILEQGNGTFGQFHKKWPVVRMTTVWLTLFWVYSHKLRSSRLCYFSLFYSWWLNDVRSRIITIKHTSRQNAFV